MRVTQREFTQGDTCLKYFDHKSATAVVDDTFAGAKEVDGRKILYAGTPFPSNDTNCLGYVLQDYDITNGSQTVAYVFAGSIDKKVLEKNSVTVDDTAKKATPRVTFFD